MNIVTIVKLDNYGRGITYIDGKITFVKEALPNEEVKVKIIKENKKYNIAKVIEYLNSSKERQDVDCPYYNDCDGCNLRHLSYDEACNFKIKKVEGILKKYANIERKVDIVKSSSFNNYRNKVTLKIKNSKIGYYKEKSHELICIDKCLLVKDKINDIISKLHLFKIKNGEVVIRVNYEDKVLISIKTLDNIDKEEIIKDKDIIGIVLNDKTIYGSNYFIDKINNLSFKVSYNSFFQVNMDVASLLFLEIRKYLKGSNRVLDLYCGVGSIGLNIADKVKELYGVEVIKNAVVDANINARDNNLINANYVCGKVEDVIFKLPSDIDTIIVDPPRSGLDKKTREELLNIRANNIIYVSCDIITLSRDINEFLEVYNVDVIKCFDMFPNTYHVECVCILKLRQTFIK